MFQYSKAKNTNSFVSNEWNYKRTLGLAMAQALFLTPARSYYYKLHAVGGSFARALCQTTGAYMLCHSVGLPFHCYLLDREF